MGDTMATAFKLPNVPGLVERIVAGRKRLDELQARAMAEARSIHPELRAVIRADRTGRIFTHVEFVPWTPSAPELPEGWHYLKTRNRVEPRRGKARAEEQALFASLQPDFEQPGHVINETGLPNIVFHSNGGGIPAWMAHEDSLYALIDGEELWEQIPAPWISVSTDEIAEADRARRASDVPLPVGR